MDRWRNKVAIVTGAASGIGAASSRALLDNGIIVAGLDIKHDQMIAELKLKLPVEQQARFHAIQCDLRSETDIRAAVNWVDQHLNGADILINNAGVSFANLRIIDENNTLALREVVDVNLIAVALCTREVFQSIKRRNAEGHVIMINSITSRSIPPLPLQNWNLYPATKQALTAMTCVLRREFLQEQANIKISSISPGSVETGFTTPAYYVVDMAKIQPEDIADAVIYCLQTRPNVQVRELIVEPVSQMV